MNAEQAAELYGALQQRDARERELDNAARSFPKMSEALATAGENYLRADGRVQELLAGHRLKVQEPPPKPEAVPVGATSPK